MDMNNIAWRKLLVANQEIASCVGDLSRLIIQGPREDNAAAAGGIAFGLRRAAALLDGQQLGMDPDPKHKDH